MLLRRAYKTNEENGRGCYLMTIGRNSGARLNLPAVQLVRLRARLSFTMVRWHLGLKLARMMCSITWSITFWLQTVTFDLVFFFGSLLQWMWPCGRGLQHGCQDSARLPRFVEVRLGRISHVHMAFGPQKRQHITRLFLAKLYY